MTNCGDSCKETLYGYVSKHAGGHRSEPDDQPALRRAVYLHQRIGGKIKAFLPIYDFSYEMTTLLSPDERTAMRQGVISQRTAWIREQAKYYIDAGIPLDIKVVWHNRPFEAIIQKSSVLSMTWSLKWRTSTTAWRR